MMKIINRYCDQDGSKPRFSWSIEADEQQNVYQEKYQIEVIDMNEKVVWDSEIVESDASVLVEYGGDELKYGQTYKWRVRVWLNCGDIAFSEYSTFSTPLKTFDAPFVSGDDEAEDSKGIALRKSINVKKAIKQASIYATALGLYEIVIEGSPITDTCFNPGWTAYEHRLLYQKFDLTTLFKTGDNELRVHLGAGWYKGDLGYQVSRNHYGNKMAFAAEIHITYEDDEQEIIKTDTSFEYANCEVLYSELYHGEVYDASGEPIDWKCVEIYHPKLLTSDKILPFDGVPVRRKETFSPVAFLTTPKGENALDFGQNLAGRVKLNVRGAKGDKVVLRHAEVLDAEGNFYTDNLRNARCTDTYILKGTDEETYEPLFTFHGFRYVCIDEYPGEINPDDFEAIAIYSDMKPTGSFTCDHPLINQLQSNITWSLKGNFLDIPTDCPQRDERLGWTGDAQVFIHAASYLYDVRTFFRKWLRDLSLEQTPEGGVPFIIPNILKDLKPDQNNTEGVDHSSCGWGDAAVIIPWAMYQYYGDNRLLKEQYPSMKAWVEYIKSQSNDNLWNTGFHFADWVALDAKEGSYFGATPTDLCATAFYAHCTGLLAKSAADLGYDEDTIYYENLYQDIVKAYQDEFFTPSGRLAAPTQTAHILSLMFDLTPNKFISRTIQGLVKLIEDNGGHLVTGFLGTPYFCHALSQNGQLDEAYKLLEREEYPSWLFQVKQDATTIWEHMDGIKEDGSMWSPDMNSFNHYAYGAVGDWLYQVVAGITPIEAGYKKISIAPKPGGSLKFARGTLETPYGTVSSHWEKEEDKFKLNVEIPVNTTAIVTLPDGIIHNIGSGKYEFAAKIKV